MAPLDRMSQWTALNLPHDPKAFNQNQFDISAGAFTDVPPDYWAASAIEEAYETGFMGGYPGTLFLPDQEIPKVQAIVALANGLNLTASGSASDIVSTYYRCQMLPTYAVDDVAAATQANVVVNYPNVSTQPLMPLTRAEAAAHLYQALVRLDRCNPLLAMWLLLIILWVAVLAAIKTLKVSNLPPTTLSNIVDLARLVVLYNIDFCIEGDGLAESLQNKALYSVCSD